MSRIFKIAAAVVAASLTFASAALAQEPSMRVAYGDIDTSSVAGGKILLSRIEAAAQRVCVQAVSHSNLTPRAAANCRRQTVESTVRQLNIGMLTLAWSGKYPPTNLASR